MRLDVINLQDSSNDLPLEFLKRIDGRKQKLTVCECNKLSQNNNVISNINAGMPMQNKIYKQLEIEQGEMKVILEFPQDSKDEDYIKEEVKSILSKILQEHLEKIS